MRTKRSIISILLCLALILTSFAALNAVQATAANTKKVSTGNSNTGELVLKCWNWPISVIENKLDEIAEAGFTVIETSAVNGIVGSGNEVSNWYQFYQPTNYNIGNKIGTEDEFKTLCANAKAKGIKIIVDVVLNHTTDQQSMVDSSLRHWHSSTNSLQGDDYNDRYKVTQWRQSGMPDLDTGNSAIQSAANTFLKRMINDGASGFRFDAAKHIELPSKYDGKYNCASDYWPNALNGVNATFMYGEVLGGTNANEYMNYMKITDSGYSGNIKYNISNWQLPASAFTNYDHGADPDYLVNYVETHDNYVSDGNYGMSNFQVQLAWAAIAAMGNNCMYLARPYGIETDYYTGTGKPSSDSRSNYEYFQQVLASGKYATQGGDGAYLRDEVSRVNKFHNAMSGQSTSLTNINNNTQVLAVTRGTKGVCIINAGSSDVTLSNYSLGVTSLSGTYTSNSQSFTVSNGNVSGKVKAGQIYTIYNASSSEVSLSDCYLHGWIGNQDYTGTDYHFNSSGSLTATFTSDSYVYINANGNDYKTAQYVSGNSGTFNMGNSEKMFVPAGTATFTLTKSGSGFNLSYTTSGGNVTEPTNPTNPTTENVVYLKPNSNWKQAGARFAAYFYGTSGSTWASMSSTSDSGVYKCTVPSGTWGNIIFCRMNGSTTTNNWDNKWNQTGDLTLTGNIGKCFTVPDGAWDGSTTSWGSYTPPTYNYTVNYTYDVDGTTKTITKAVNNSTLTDADTIAAINDPSSKLKDPSYTYTLGKATKSGTTITAPLTKSARTYTVKVNGNVFGTYNFLDQAEITNTGGATGFEIGGNLVYYGTKFKVFVTGNLDITTNSSATREDVATISHIGTQVTNDQLSLELLATANVDGFKSMGVAYAMAPKTSDQIQAAVNNVSGTSGSSNKIGVHKSAIDYPNSSGQYQFRYAPHMTVNTIRANSTMYFYTYAVTDDGFVVSGVETVAISSLIS